MNSEKLRVLFVEDSEDDVLLMMEELMRGGYDPVCKRVEDLDDLIVALNNNEWDIVISDYRLPHCDGLEILRVFQERGLDLPFIIVSGTVGEELAVKTMKAGAHDYLMKDNLTRLNAAVDREIREAQMRLERKNAENELEHAYERLKTANAQLIQSEKMSAIGQLAAGVAHEINNPAGFVLSNINTLSDYVETYQALVKKTLALVDEIGAGKFKEAESICAEIKKIKEKEDLDFIQEDMEQLFSESRDGMDRIRDIVQSLKGFARVDDNTPKEADINELLETTLKVAWNELKYKCDIEKHLSPLPRISCFPSQLNQVFLNLLVNAAYSITNHGVITLETALENHQVVIRISDTGRGIPPKNLKKIFEPFFTTKPIGVGTGLGLSISYGIIQSHNGEIQVESEEGKGTTFTILLPLGEIEI